MPLVTAIIFSGGTGSRMNSRALPKQFLNMHGKPIIIHTLEKFERHAEVDNIVVACLASWIDYLNDLIERYNLKKVSAVVPGGDSAQMSVHHALCEAERIAGGERTIVLIHDGVRPLINDRLISENIASVRAHGSAITSVKVKETVLIVEDGNETAIASVPNRASTRLARAPQSFWLDEILAMQRRAIAEGVGDFIDSCTLMQHYGQTLYLVDGPLENIKITTPDDFYTMRALLDAKENSQIYGFEE